VALTDRSIHDDQAPCGVHVVGPDVGKVGGCSGRALETNYVFARNTPQVVISMVVPYFWSSRNLTSGSGVRGKAGPNWVRKVFNCLCSL
jgi:hypothetical protein